MSTRRWRLKRRREAGDETTPPVLVTGDHVREKRGHLSLDREKKRDDCCCCPASLCKRRRGERVDEVSAFDAWTTKEEEEGGRTGGGGPGGASVSSPPLLLLLIPLTERLKHPHPHTQAGKQTLIRDLFSPRISGNMSRRSGCQVSGPLFSPLLPSL